MKHKFNIIKTIATVGNDQVLLGTKMGTLLSLKPSTNHLTILDQFTEAIHEIEMTDEYAAINVGSGTVVLWNLQSSLKLSF